MSNICPNCNSPVAAVAYFCKNCCAELDRGRLPNTKKIGFDDLGILDTKHKLPTIAPSPPENTSPLSLVIMETREVIPLEASSKDIILGRNGEGTSPLPDINLASNGGLKSGISRQHAMIKVDNLSYYITDLSSTNGTRINGEKIIPHQDHLLYHGDLLSLGRLLIQVLVSAERSPKQIA